MTFIISLLLIYQALCLFLLAMPKYTKTLGREFKPLDKQITCYRTGAWLLMLSALFVLSLHLGFANALVVMFGATALLATVLSVAFEKAPFLSLFPVIPNKKPINLMITSVLLLELTLWFLL